MALGASVVRTSTSRRFAVSCELCQTSSACCSGVSSAPNAAWMPPCALAELHDCSAPFVTRPTRATPASAETAAARPEAPLPTTSTSKRLGSATTARLYHGSTNNSHFVRLCLRSLQAAQDAPAGTLQRLRHALLVRQPPRELHRPLHCEAEPVPRPVDGAVLGNLRRDRRRAEDVACVLEAPRLKDQLVGHPLRALEPGRVVHRDDPALDDLRDPALEVLEDEVVLVRAVDEEELDRLIEAVRKILGA